MNKYRRTIAVFAIIGFVFGAGEVLAMSAGPTIRCSLGGKKVENSDFMHSNGHYYKLSMNCTSNSAYGTYLSK